MARPKKVVLSIDEKIEKIKTEIESLNAEIKEKKAELKELEKEKAEENKMKILAAVEESGKSVEEILELLKK